MHLYVYKGYLFFMQYIFIIFPSLNYSYIFLYLHTQPML